MSDSSLRTHVNPQHLGLHPPRESLCSRKLCKYSKHAEIWHLGISKTFLVVTTVAPHRDSCHRLKLELSSHHLFLNCEGRWGTTDDFATSFIHSSLFSTALWDLPNSRPVHSLMLFFHLFLCLPCLLPPFIVPCKMVLARPDERET